MGATPEEHQTIFAELRANHGEMELTLAVMVNAIGTFLPPDAANVLMPQLGLCVRARALELGLSPLATAKAIDAVVRANKTLAHLNLIPSDSEVDFALAFNGPPRF